MKSQKKRFDINYTNKQGDVSYISVMATNATQAEKLCRKNWDIDKILKIQLANDIN